MMTLQGQMLAFVQGANMWIANVGAGTSIQLQGHTADIQGVRMVQDETLISWGSDGTLRLWHMGSAAQLKVLDHHIILAGKKTTDTDGLPVIEGCVPLKGGKLLSWVHPGYGMTLCVWTEHGDLITDYPLPEHNSNALRAVQVINNGKVLLETYRRTYAIWHPVDGGDVDTILAETIDWAMPLSSGLVFVAGGVQVGFCSGYDGAVLEANGTVHDAAVVGATELRDGRIVSWDADHVAVVWSASGGLLNKLAGHTGPVQGAVALGADHVITWSLDDTVRIWSQRGRMTLHEVYARKDLWRERPEVAGLVDAELGRPAAPEVIMRHRSGVLGVATGQRGHVGLALNACAPEDRKIMAIGRSGVTIFSPREGLLFLRLMHGLTPLRVDQWVRHYAPSSTEDPAS
jgi:WD40 repeat protein